MDQVLVLGLGSRLMRDDGIGVAVVEALAAVPSGGWGRDALGEGSLRFAVGETDFAYCLNLAMGAELLVLVDAVEMGAPPGEVLVIPLSEITPGAAGISLHDTHFLDLLLQVAPDQRGVLIGIAPSRIDFHLGLSPELETRFGAILDGVKSAIQQVAGLGAPDREQCHKLSE